MQRYILRRAALAVLTIIGASILIFIAMRVIPGDPLATIYSEAEGTYMLTEEEEAAARASLGLDRPLPVQYFDWMADVARGDLGYSFWTQEPIRNQVLRRAPITIQISLVAVALSWIVGVPIGMLSAVRRNSLADNASRFIVTLFLAIPSFWVGLVFILFTVVMFSWRPPLTIVPLWEDPIHNFQMVVPPGIAVGLGLAAVIARMTRSTMLEVLREDYVRTARAKGVAERPVILRHVFRNALIPVITTSGVAMGGLLAGTVATETAFGVPGLGRMLVQGINNRDWMIIQNLVLIYAVIFTMVNLLVDISYSWIDPRIKYL